MGHSAGKPWMVDQNQKLPLTQREMKAKTKEITSRFRDLFVAYGLAINILVEEADALGLLLLSESTKQLLSDAAARCADGLMFQKIVE